MTGGNGDPAALESLDATKARALGILGIKDPGAALSPTAVEILQIVDRLPRYAGAGHTSQPNPMREIRSRLGDRWSLLILVLLRAGDFHPGALRRLVNLIRTESSEISRKVLTTHLRQLERDGLIQRTVLSPTPLRVIYQLRPLGRDLLRMWDSLREWTYEHAPEILAAQCAFDQANGSASMNDSGS